MALVLSNTIIVILAMASFISYATSTSRNLPEFDSRFDYLTAELEETGDLGDCWNGLMEIKSCSNEIVNFFLNGKADIGAPCCKAVGVIMKQCVPSMLTSLGFTVQEGNALSAYCDSTMTTTDQGPSATPDAYAPNQQPPSASAV